MVRIRRCGGSVITPYRQRVPGVVGIRCTAITGSPDIGGGSSGDRRRSAIVIRATICRRCSSRCARAYAYSGCRIGRTGADKAYTDMVFPPSVFVGVLWAWTNRWTPSCTIGTGTVVRPSVCACAWWRTTIAKIGGHRSDTGTVFRRSACVHVPSGWPLDWTTCCSRHTGTVFHPNGCGDGSSTCWAARMSYRISRTSLADSRLRRRSSRSLQLENTPSPFHRRFRFRCCRHCP